MPTRRRRRLSGSTVNPGGNTSPRFLHHSRFLNTPCIGHTPIHWSHSRSPHTFVTPNPTVVHWYIELRVHACGTFAICYILCGSGVAYTSKVDVIAFGYTTQIQGGVQINKCCTLSEREILQSLHILIEGRVHRWGDKERNVYGQEVGLMPPLCPLA